jgi:pimeloyl-ACP methyl ester carboxylesterase
MEQLFEELLYYPDRLPATLPPPRWASGAREVWMEADDGVTIHGLWWPEPEDRPAVLFLHGNAQEVYSWSLVHQDLAGLDCRLLLIDYHGYGKSGGRPHEAGLYADGRAALRWLEDNGVPAADTLIFGKSLGGAVACHVARGLEVKGLILESTFTSLASVARNLFPFAGGYTPDEGVYNSIEKLPRIQCPLLIIHGDGDALIPVEEGLALYEAANQPKELIIVEGAGHNDVSLCAGDRYGASLRNWLDGLETGD